MITCDYLPGNPGHALAHQYLNISTTDQTSVLAAAGQLGIDGVLAYASDPAAPTAAYVAAGLGLPGCPPEAVHRLTDKAAFRAHLSAHGFNGPRFEEVRNAAEAEVAARRIGYPVIIKPCDSSGSKGVSRVTAATQIPGAIRDALSCSRSSRVIVERWVTRRGQQIAGDGLVLGGRTVFACFGDERFDPVCSDIAPAGESFPGHLEGPCRTRLIAQLDTLFKTLDVRDLVFNLDAMIDEDGEPLIIEIGARAGGNCLPQVIEAHTGVDLTTIAIRLALGEPIDPQAVSGRPRGFHASWMIHARTDGHLREYHMAEELRPFLTALDFLVAPGAPVRKFSSSSDTLGYACFAFPDEASMHTTLSAMGELIGASTR